MKRKKATEKQDFAAAEVNLNQALTQSQDEVLTSIVALRLSAVQFQLGQLDNALTTLNQVKGESFNARKAIFKLAISKSLKEIKLRLKTALTKHNKVVPN